MILVIDNYDSFAYNLVQYVGEFDDVVVRRNDAVDVADVRALDPDGIVVSPGPGTPEAAGVSIPIFEELSYPTLGVCLGHQALCAANGATVGHAPEVVHGKPSLVRHDGAGLYDGVDDPFEVGRYHSLAVERDDIPGELEETAHTIAEGRADGADGVDGSNEADGTDGDDGIVMGVRHRERPHIGMQFHPESILTSPGKRIIENFCTSIAGG
ncbi:anthranilate/aminodeoxychorismate synthase component II [Halorubrum sp. Ib24]|uniref:anthranilate synthase component II n=1 Tax=unclassified Halorubrum TaxID=2642239 RepID=UPI000B98354A|nr:MULTISPECIES: aminodeoxychorismate/anthranilate synthase component II [unclassified Halorubrum]OYR42976.1 anthranilate/aminodeoxychorismate synthase component II [Halorubrum sp. Ib24]OYR43517.1 anthranilate/aminodeoxychorismate synthase component II [Halorubrum sp. Hd13]OYR46484.1 anthranilate/aminodeoxychorismate synthase component II [Halorubrum sp. Ea8]OYR47250.1 anthranilate/aminodeoxychorismate synthase component II [Halorubrum sp. Eb13]OYR55081.1 anthranilate/aminodeoxychorismate synt